MTRPLVNFSEVDGSYYDPISNYLDQSLKKYSFYSSSALSYLFVAVQFISIIVLFLTGPIVASGILFVVQSAGLFIAVWAIISMRKGKLKILPDVSEQAILITEGPYKRVRHPMYISLMVIMTVLVFEKTNVLRILVLIVLWVDLVGKLLYEEKLLNKHFEGYEEYSRQSWRLIPFIF